MMRSTASPGAITTRTQNPVTEAIQLLVELMPFAVAAGLLIAILWSQPLLAFFVVPASLAFGAIGVVNFRQDVLQVATKLSFEPATGLLTWSNRFKNGSVPVAAILRIERSDPGRYQIVLRDSAATAVPFWFTPDRRAGVRCLTDGIVTANPNIDLSQLLEPKFGWPGLEGRRSLLRGQRKLRN